MILNLDTRFDKDKQIHDGETVKLLKFASVATVVATLTTAALLGCGDDAKSPTYNSGRAPNAPQNFRASQATPTAIRLDWRDASTDEDGFEIQESVSNSDNFRSVATVAANVDSVILVDRYTDSLYFYRMRSFNTGGNSPFTAVIQFTCGYLANTYRPEGGPVTSICFDPTGGYLATGLGNFAIMTWEIASGAATHTYNGHNQPVSQVQYLLNGNMLLSRAADVGRVWPLQVGLEEYTFTANKVLFSPDGRFLAVENDEGVFLEDPANGDVIMMLDSTSRLGAFSANGKYLACERPFKYWDLTDSLTMRTPIIPERAIDGSIYSLSPDGSLVAVDYGANRQTVRIIRIADFRVMHELVGHSRAVKTAIFTTDGALMATGSDDWTIKIWDMTNGQLKRTLAGHSGVIHDIAWDPDGKYIASASGDMTAKRWGPLR